MALRLLRPLRGNLALLLVSSVFTLLALEGLFRAFDLRGYHTRRTRAWRRALVRDQDLPPGVQIRFKPYSQFRLNYDSNPRGYFDERNGLVYKLNRYGFRGPDYARAKRPGVRRVAVVGDSFTFGEGVKLEDTFCRRLEGLLTSRAGLAVEVLNFGTSGWGTTDEVHFLEQEGLGFQPDLVVLVYVLNDAGYAGDLDLWEDFRDTYEKRWLRWSYLASWVYAAVGRRTLGDRYARQVVQSALEDREAWRESFRALSRGHEIARAGGAGYLVCLFPFLFKLDEGHPFKPAHERLAAHCIINGIPFLDLLEAFRGRADTELWVHPADQHPNEKAHAIAAEAMAGFILDRGLLSPR